MRKNGFISISLIYTFFILFLILMVFLLNNYSSTRFMLDQYKSDIKNDYVEWQSADINLYYMVWNDVTNSYEMENGISSELEGNYEYQPSVSYCDNNSSMTYNPTTREFTIKAIEKDRCFVYFRQSVNVNIFTRESDTSQYFPVRIIPGYNYKLDTSSGNCTNTTKGVSCRCDSRVSIEFDEKNRTYSLSTINKGSTCELKFTRISTNVTTSILMEDNDGTETRDGDTRKYIATPNVPNTDIYRMDGIVCSKNGDKDFTVVKLENGKLVTESSVDNDCKVYFIKDRTNEYNDIKVNVFVWENNGYKLSTMPTVGYKYYSGGCTNGAEIIYDYKTLKVMSNGPTECNVYFRRG